MKLGKYIKLSIIVFWPLSLLLHNTFGNFLTYFIPTIFLFIGFQMYKNNSDNYFYPLLAIPFISPKLALIPLLFSISLFIVNRKKFTKKFFLLSSLIFLLFFKPFWGQTIFHPDYEANQLILRNINLYPTPLFARAFQNKGIVFVNKFNNNLFSLIDPTNYFFGFHPRENYIGNQNLDKFPYLSLPFFLFGIYCFNKLKNKRFITITVFTSLLTLSMLTNFDRTDFILYLPLTLIVLSGLNIVHKKLKRKTKPVYILFLIFTAHQFIRLFLK